MQYNRPTDEQIRTRAYYLWEADGRPQNRDWDYWLKAREQLEREAQAGSGNGSNRKAASTTAEKAEKTTTRKSASRTPAFA
jgi:hypothetical protein